MKVTLDLDPTLLAAEVTEVLKALTVEEKKEMAKQVLTNYYADFRKFEDGEKETKRNEIIAQVRANAWSGSHLKKATDEEVMQDSDFKDRMYKIKTFSQIMREEISAALRIQLQAQVKELIENDEGYKVLVQEAMQAVKEAFPQMVQQAMVQHMAGQMSGIQSQLYSLGSSLGSRIDHLEGRR